MISIFLILLGGLFNRIRGGLFNVGSTTLGRAIPALFWGGLLAYSVVDVVRPPTMFYLYPPAFFLGLIWGWGTFMDLGRTTGPSGDDTPVAWIVGGEDNDRPFHLRWLRDAVGLMLRGTLLLAFPATLHYFLTGITPTWMVLGAAMFPIYEIGIRLGETDLVTKTGGEYSPLQPEFLFGMYITAILLFLV